MQDTRVQSLGQEDPMENGMATRSSILLSEKFHGQRSLAATIHGVAKSWMWHLSINLYEVKDWANEYLMEKKNTHQVQSLRCECSWQDNYYNNNN